MRPCFEQKLNPGKIEVCQFLIWLDEYKTIPGVHKSIHFLGMICQFTWAEIMAQYLYYHTHQTKQLKP